MTIKHVNAIDSVKSPLKYVKHRYESMVKDNSFKVHFADRNNHKVILPFLKGIKVDFRQINQLLLVKSTPTLVQQLMDLGFVSDYVGVDVNNTSSNKYLEQISNKYYNYDFNIEIVVVGDQYWDLIMSADIIMSDLKSKDEKCVTTFLTVFNSLCKISKI